jgi:hypothetical protein
MGRQWTPDRQGVAGQARQGLTTDAVSASVQATRRAAGLVDAGDRGGTCAVRGARPADAGRLLTNRGGHLPAFGELLPLGALG